MTEARPTWSGQERVERPHEIFSGLDVRGVPRGELHQARGQERRGLTGRFQGHGVIDAVQEEGAGRLAVREGLSELRAEIVGTQALPYRLLRTRRDAERGHLARLLRIVKLARHR